MAGHTEDRLTALAGLPGCEPPAALEARTLAAMAAATRPRAIPRLAAAAVWLAVFGAAAAVSLATLDVELPGAADSPAAAAVDAEAAAGLAADGAVRNPPVAAGPEAERYYALLAESARLEWLLYELPPPRRVMRVSTAGTIVGLENRIALLDSELIRARAASGPSEYRAALLRERVDAMSALVNVRYAQSQAFHF